MGTNIQSYPTSPSTLVAASSSGTQTPKQKTQRTCLNTAKVHWLRSTSGLAMTVSEKSRAFVRAPEEVNLSGRTRTGLASFLWVMHWIMRLTLGRGLERYEIPDIFRVSSEPTHGRYQRMKTHMARRKSVPVVRIISHLFRILSRRMSANQYLEFLARTSVCGRISAYGLRYWGNVLQRRAQLSCVDHGWWRAPAAASISGGLWDVQLPPN